MQNLKPLFTVAIITYNSAKYVRQAIESVLASSYINFELIISDDASTDNTWGIIEDYRDVRIKSWRNKKNIGEYPNRNKVLKQALGEYILYVDGDDILYKNTLRNLSEYIDSFPEAGMVWGLNPQNFPFFVFPYLVEPSINMKLIYCTHIPISIIGFGEILFKKNILLFEGGFSEKYKSGDNYIKKTIAIKYAVLYINIGFMFWRQSLNQASKNLSNGFESFLERYTIDKLVVENNNFPITGNEYSIISKNLKISYMKLHFSDTVLKGNFKLFFKYYSSLNFKFSDIKLIFQKGDYSYNPSSLIDEPLMNKFNFKSNSSLKIKN